MIERSLQMKINSENSNYLILFVVVFVTVLLLDLSSAIPVQADNTKTNKNGPKYVSTNNIQKNKTIVYYFHGNMRCKTCKTIEAFTRETLENKFKENLKNGSMELKVVNVDKSDNTHFVKDYQLFTRSVVVSNKKNGKEINWKRLDRVWELVKDKAAFLKYVQSEINSVMKGES